MKLSTIFKCKKETGEDELQTLKEENRVLKEKLAERQQIINKTNAYWKKRLAMQRSSQQHRREQS